MDNVSRSPCLSHMAASVEGIATISSFDQGQRFYLRLGSVLVDTYNLKCSEYDMITIKNIPMWVFLWPKLTLVTQIIVSPRLFFLVKQPLAPNYHPLSFPLRVNFDILEWKQLHCLLPLLFRQLLCYWSHQSLHAYCIWLTLYYNLLTS